MLPTYFVHYLMIPYLNTKIINNFLAERTGFEPAIELPQYTLSKRAPSTTRPPLQRCANCSRFLYTMSYPFDIKIGKRTNCAFQMHTNCVIIKMMVLFARDKLIMKKLGRNIAYIRGDRGFTQEKLADLTNLSRRAIQSIEGGERWPRPSTLVALALALKVPLDSLFKGVR
jgi:DNA-binding XRE family transcriptional regulator